jgi:hypothetical protein
MFKYGDIVKLKSDIERAEYYIVTDICDFSDNEDGSEMEYQIMRIYPVFMTSLVSVVEEEKIEYLGDRDDEKTIIDFVMKERNKRGWYGIPDFIIAIGNNLNADEKMKAKKKKIKKPKDVIRYDKLNNIDDCLIAIYDLKTLHEMFGDESYIQLKELVIETAKQLTKAQE